MPKEPRIEIRLANQKDAAHIALLARFTFGETFGHLFSDKQDLLDYYNSTFSIEKIESGLAKSNNIFWVAFVDRLPVGYAKLKLNSPTDFLPNEVVSQLQKIYVLKDFLSMKIGYKLQKILLTKVKENEIQKVWLSVLEGNERAINFYKKNGFTPIGKHDFNIGKEYFKFIAMAKPL